MGWLFCWQGVIIKMKKIIRSKILYGITIITAALTIVGAVNYNNTYAAEKETFDLRVIGTTDIHGQLSSTDYELGVDRSIGGLARVADLIRQTKNELPAENTITVDTGDTLFDYTTEYIHSEYSDEIQPIYKAMALVGYDAISLGNHDFDYGYDYILKQLKGTGLMDVTIVSNVTDSKTGEHPFLENMLITREVKTSKGNKVEVKIGIIGQTIPTLTGKTHSYTGILKGEDMVTNARTQAAKLKEMGADIIVAVSHTGIGPVNPELNFKNVAYALTLIDDIDVVVAGHEHNLFPTSDMTSAYYNLPGVERKTFLMNGKNVIMAGDRGSAIGVVDLTLEVRNQGFRIIDRHSELRMVTKSNTKEDPRILSLFGDLEKELMQYTTEVIGVVEKNELIQNYFGLLGDNAAIQLLNDSKISYALDYVVNNAPEYRNYPIIAASTYESYGSGSVDNFVSIGDEITESDLAELQSYNNYIYVYTITGKQLREWLEWSASAYETTLLTKSWSDMTMASLMKETASKSLIREEWLDDWSSFYIFDGIEYVINPNVEPRYDISGNKISLNSRVKSITHNGKEVTDETKLIIATNKITKPVAANRGVENQVVYKSFNRSQFVLADYVKQLSKSGSIIPQVDFNWKVEFPSNYKFIAKVPYYGHDLMVESPWFEKYLTEVNQYRYYLSSYKIDNKDQEGPHIVAMPGVTSPTASQYNVEVIAFDKSEIKELRYIKGDYDITYSGWMGAGRINNRTFSVRDNDTYTIYAEDIHGNKTIRKVVIDNFSDDLLGRPTHEKYTNRKSNIKGSAEPGATIVFKAYTGTYKGKVASNGKYAYPLPSQPSGSTVIAYVIDENTAVEGERITIPVHRTGPNQPAISAVDNSSPYITGNTNDTDGTVIAIIDGRVYLSDDGAKALYESNTEIYNPSLEIVETKYEVTSEGYFALYIPSLEAGQSVQIYNLDHVSRNSRLLTTSVKEIAPNAPMVYEVSNIEKSLRGYVPSTSKKAYDITLNIADKEYTTKTDNAGNFSFQFTDQLQAGQVLRISATDYKNGARRTSYLKEIIVNDIENYVRSSSSVLTMTNVSQGSYMISGDSLNNNTVYLAIAYPKGDTFSNILNILETDEFDRYRYTLDEVLPFGTKVYVMTRFTDGRILLANKSEVLPPIPEAPMLVKEISNTDKKAQVIAGQDLVINLTIGTKSYETAEYVYDEVNDQYVYTFATDRDVSGTDVVVTATNAGGTSAPYTSKLVKAAPDQPKVNKIAAGNKTISGTVDLLDDKTTVVAQIGKKTYKGSVDKKGKYTIEIPKQKKGTAIKIWGSNKAGRGPLIKVTVE